MSHDIDHLSKLSSHRVTERDVALAAAPAGLRNLDVETAADDLLKSFIRDDSQAQQRFELKESYPSMGAEIVHAADSSNTIPKRTQRPAAASSHRDKLTFKNERQ